MPQPEKKDDLAPLATPQFAAIFAADLEPEVVTCTVGDGLECRFWLRMMDASDRNRFLSMGVKVSAGADGAEMREADLALDERTMLIVSCTVIDWEFWHKPNPTADWQLNKAPQEPRARKDYISRQFKCVPAFWDWLTTHCLRVNQLLGDTPGN